MGNFANRTVIVTGGAGGVGRGISKAFLRAGADVFICGRQLPESVPTAAAREAVFVRADIRNSTQSKAVIDAAIAKTGRLDILINNAGGSPQVRAAEASPGFSNAIIALNLIAPIVLAQQAFGYLSAGGRGGCIINIASLSGVRASPGTAAYGAAKAGLINVSQSLAQEWGPERVRVNAIVAGLISTPAASAHYGGRDGIERIESALPMGRMATAQDIANACLFLAAETSQYISGAALEVHGGGEAPPFLQLQGQPEK